MCLKNLPKWFIADKYCPDCLQFKVVHNSFKQLDFIPQNTNVVHFKMQWILAEASLLQKRDH